MIRLTVQWAVLKCRNPASRLPTLFTTSRGGKFADTCTKRSTDRNRVGSRQITDWATGKRALKRHDTKQNVFERRWKWFWRNKLRIIRGNFNIQACNPILVVPPNAVINPKKVWYGIVMEVVPSIDEGKSILVLVDMTPLPWQLTALLSRSFPVTALQSFGLILYSTYLRLRK